jgi:RNA polymerase sigma-70 factor (ECF subfamily)
LRTGDGIDEVVERYSALVYRLALTHVKSPHDAADVFQEVFLRYIRKERAFESEEHRRAWLIRVTVNRCKSLKSSAWFRRTERLNDSMVYEDEELSDLMYYLRLLPPKYRSAVYLFYVEDYSVKQIAEALGSKEGTVKSRLSRARAMLRDELKGEFGYE